MDNAFEKMCRDLSRDKECIMQVACKSGKDYNEILCAQNAVNDYVKGDKNKLLKLKAEADDLDYHKYLSQLISYLAMFLSALAVMFAFMSNVTTLGPLVKSEELKSLYNKIISDNADVWFSMGFVVMMLAVVFGAGAIYFINRNRCINYWRPYILVVINDLEKNHQNKNKQTNYQYSVVGFFMQKNRERMRVWKK